MIRKRTNGDISDEEFERVLKPFLDDYDNFVLSYIMPEVIAYYIANSYYRGSMYEGSFLQHYNSAKDLINLFGEDYEQMKAEVFKLLKIKYALIVVNEDPLEIKKIKYEFWLLILYFYLNLSVKSSILLFKVYKDCL